MNSKFFLAIIFMVFMFVSCENETQRGTDSEKQPDSTVQPEDDIDTPLVDDNDAIDEDDFITDDDMDTPTIDDSDTVDGDNITTDDDEITTPDNDTVEGSCETPGEVTKVYTCSDGSEVDWCTCGDDYTVYCINSPESLCEESDEIPTPDEDYVTTPDEDASIEGTVLEMGNENATATGELTNIFRGNELSVEDAVTLKEIAMYLKPSSNITFVIYKKEVSGVSIKYVKKDDFETTVSSPASDYAYYSTGEISFDLDGENWNRPSSYIIGVYSSGSIAATYGDAVNPSFGSFENSITKKELESIPETLEDYNSYDDSAYQMRLIFE